MGNSVQVIRGGHLESYHTIHAAVVDAAGRLLAFVGDPQTFTFLRSAAKPFQTLALLRAGAGERFSLTDAEIAVICASHNGEDMHISQVQGMMNRTGVTLDLLQCGYHAPFHPPQNEKIVKESLTPNALYNNCSGKHVGKLAACLHQGLATDNYLDIDHPHQQRIHALLSEYSDTASLEIGVATDGCGAPTFYLSLFGMATMFAKLAASDRTEERRVLKAMSSHPELVAGTGRFDTRFMETAGSGIISKVGAEALQCFAIPGDDPLGIAVKCQDGHARGVESASVEILRQWGILSDDKAEALKKFWQPTLRNHVGKEVGSVKPDLEVRAGQG